MNTRRLTKKYKYKNRNKKTRRNRKSRRRVLKGGLPSVSRASSRSSVSGIPRGFIVNRTSGSSRFRPSSVRPSDSAGISKSPIFSFEYFYNKLMNTPVDKLEITLQHNKDVYFKNTTFQTFEPKGAYPNMNGLKFLNYLHGKFNIERGKRKNHLKSIISQLDQVGMAPALRPTDLRKIEKNITAEYFTLYSKLYNEIYKKLFPYGNPNDHPLSTSVIPLYCKPHLQTVHEDDDDE